MSERLVAFMASVIKDGYLNGSADAQHMDRLARESAAALLREFPPIGKTPPHCPTCECGRTPIAESDGAMYAALSPYVDALQTEMYAVAPEVDDGR